MYNTLFHQNYSIYNNFTPEAFVERSVFTNTHGCLLDNNTYIAMKYGLSYSQTHKLHTTYLYTVRVVSPGGNLYLAFQKWLLVWDSAYIQLRNIPTILKLPLHAHYTHAYTYYIYIHNIRYIHKILLLLLLLLYTTWIIDLFFRILNSIYIDNAYLYIIIAYLLQNMCAYLYFIIVTNYNKSACCFLR